MADDREDHDPDLTAGGDPSAAFAGLPRGFATALGVVVGKLTGIEHRMASADRSRKEMYQRFEDHNAEVAELRRDIGDLARRVGDLEVRVSEVVVVVKRVESYERTGQQALSVASVLGGSVGGVIKWALRAGLLALGAAVYALWDKLR